MRALYAISRCFFLSFNKNYAVVYVLTRKQLTNMKSRKKIDSKTGLMQTNQLHALNTMYQTMKIKLKFNDPLVKSNCIYSCENGMCKLARKQGVLFLILSLDLKGS